MDRDTRFIECVVLSEDILSLLSLTGLTSLTSSAEAEHPRQLRDAELDTVAGIFDTPPKVHSSDS